MNRRHWILLLVLYSAAASGDFETGKAAYRAGDMESARAEFAKAAEDDRAQFALGFMHANGIGGDPDYKKAGALYRLSAEQGNASAQTYLAQLYFRGLGVAQDHTQALFWYQKAAEQGRADSQYNLGGMYEQGLGTEQSNIKAFAWLTLAADGGVERAIMYLITLSERMSEADIAAGRSLAQALHDKIAER